MTSPTTEEHDLVSIAEISPEDFKKHVQRVEMCVTVLNALLASLCRVPMFAGFIPPELRAEIEKLASE